MLMIGAAYGARLGAATMLSMAQLDLHSYFVAHAFDAATYAIYAVGCFQLPFLYIVNESVGAVMILVAGGAGGLGDQATTLRRGRLAPARRERAQRSRTASGGSCGSAHGHHLLERLYCNRSDDRSSISQDTGARGAQCHWLR